MRLVVAFPRLVLPPPDGNREHRHQPQCARDRRGENLPLAQPLIEFKTIREIGTLIATAPSAPRNPAPIMAPSQPGTWPDSM